MLTFSKMTLHQAEEYSVSLVEQFDITYDGKDQQIYLVLQRKTDSEKTKETLS